MADLGKKHECSECGAKFYDLGKADPICPRCGTPVSGDDDEPRAKTKRKRRPAPAPAAAREAEDDLQSDGDETFTVDDEEIEEDLDEEDLGELDDDAEEEEEDDLED